MNGHHSQSDSAPSTGKTCTDSSDARSNVERDPVCEMRVDPGTAKHHIEYHGTTPYFCSIGCRDIPAAL
ncbi:YHS domain-containing protein [Rudaea sp.]|jgi:Cu+-exporting ATPase|uniref:YHS domain-containing protein n=1 Tax=Rudaea sp. TaxID=2136325 RepID=UPI0039C97134